MPPTTVEIANPIQPASTEAIWSVLSTAIWIGIIVAVVLIVNWLLNRWAGKPIRWPRRWATKGTT